MKPFCHIYAQWDQTGDRMEAEAQHLLDLGLIADTTFAFAQAGRHGGILQKIAAAGGLCAPNIYPANLASACRDSNWWKYSEDHCVALLENAACQFSELQLGPLLAVNTYTPGNSFVAACRKVGVRYILGFCAPIVIEDGGWEIAHYGSPLSPYFASNEDFRKPEQGNREDAVLISSMELRNPMVCLNHWSEGPWCPLNAQAADRWLEPSADPLPFLQIAEDWLRQSELSGRPLFFHINLQYFFAGRCYEHNRRALEWLAEQRDRGRIEVGGLKSWRKRLAAADGFERQTSYWRGEMMGFHVGHRPGRYPDVVVDESLGSQTVWQFPDPLPSRRYDYGKTWDYPAFQPDGSAPASDNFAAVTLEISEQIIGPQEKRATLTLNNKGASRHLPLLIWGAFENWTGPFTAQCATEGWTQRIIPHPAGQGGALLMEGTATKGISHVEITWKGNGLSAHHYSRSWGNLVCAETFFWKGRPYTYLVAQTPEEFVVKAKIQRREPRGDGVISEYLNGVHYHREYLRENRLALRFDGSRLVCWHRLWGITADEIELDGIEETTARLRRVTATKVAALCPELRLSDPGYQTFGNIRDTSRWDRAFARIVGETELRRINEWFRSQRPRSGEVLIEAHPGIGLPRGSITKVLGHEFDQVQCKEGYGFRELCADYIQGWDWGVAGWVQWRQLKVRLDGLRPGHGKFLLHLHAFDPEDRDIAQKVHLFNPEAGKTISMSRGFPVHQALELCAVPEWNLPRGVEGRWEPAALCSVEIPETCLEWPSIGVWIAPLERTKLYDWIAEQGAPGLLNHLWVTNII